MRAIKLTLAAVFTWFVLLAVLLAVSPHQLSTDNLHSAYRCLRQAPRFFLSCYRFHGRFDFSVDLFGLIYEGNTGNYIDREIYYNGAYERSILFLLRDLMTNAYSTKGVFLDIGANTGQHSLFMSRYANQIHAFEPYAPVLQRFRMLVEKNRIQNIVIHPVGLGNENSDLPFYKPPDYNLGSGSFVDGFWSANSYMGLLPIRIGDEELAFSGVKSVAVIKMDIEGYEKPALQGLWNTLIKNRPFVVFELSTNPAIKVSIKTKEELKSLFPENYEFFAIRGLGEYRLVDIAENVHFDQIKQNNVLAYPIEKQQILILDKTVP
jgi:FkbM family methyltransferase